MIPALHIHLLGDFLLVSGDTPVMTINSPRLQSLLAYLLTLSRWFTTYVDWLARTCGFAEHREQIV